MIPRKSSYTLANLYQKNFYVSIFTHVAYLLLTATFKGLFMDDKMKGQSNLFKFTSSGARFRTQAFILQPTTCLSWYCQLSQECKSLLFRCYPALALFGRLLIEEIPRPLQKMAGEKERFGDWRFYIFFISSDNLEVIDCWRTTTLTTNEVSIMPTCTRTRRW